MKFKNVNEDTNTYAIMLRRDGKVFTIPFHPYGTDGPEYTLEFAEWLYDHTTSTSTRSNVVAFVCSYCNENKITLQEASNEIEKPFTENFIKVCENSAYRDYDDVDKYDRNVNEALNQEFCRARFGGRYDSDDVLGGEIVFRISSNGFNWFNVIYDYVYSNKSKIQYVTIVKDLESTGSDNVYSHNGHKFYRMPIDEFIMLSGNPVVEEKESNNG